MGRSQEKLRKLATELGIRPIRRHIREGTMRGVSVYLVLAVVVLACDEDDVESGVTSTAPSTSPDLSFTFTSRRKCAGTFPPRISSTITASSSPTSPASPE